MLIRPYRADDLQTVHAINEAEVPAVGTETTRDLAHIAGVSTIALVAEVDAATAGFCFVLAPGADYDSVNYAWFGERYAEFVYLDRIAISPPHQGRGIGRAMYDEVVRLAAERYHAASHFLLEVNLEPRNDQSLAFHARLGFTEVGQQRTESGKLVSMMARPLP